MTRRRLSDWFIRLGLFLQVVFLAFVDWGTIVGMRSQPETPWLHVAGLIAVNIVLGVAAVVAWKWLKKTQAREAAARS